MNVCFIVVAMVMLCTDLLPFGVIFITVCVSRDSWLTVY